MPSMAITTRYAPLKDGMIDLSPTFYRFQLAIKTSEMFNEQMNPRHGTYVLDGNKKIGAHIRSNICYWTCVRHLIR